LEKLASETDDEKNIKELALQQLEKRKRYRKVGAEER